MVDAAKGLDSNAIQATFCAANNTITLTNNNYTLRWAAPELLLDDEVSPWSDIWALGWIIYEVGSTYCNYRQYGCMNQVLRRF